VDWFELFLLSGGDMNRMAEMLKDKIKVIEKDIKDKEAELEQLKNMLRAINSMKKVEVNYYGMGEKLDVEVRE